MTWGAVTIWLGWAALAAGLALAFVCSGVETGTYVLNKIRLDLRAESGHRHAARLRGLLQRPEETLTVLLLLTNIAIYVASAALVALLTVAGAGNVNFWTSFLSRSRAALSSSFPSP